MYRVYELIDKQKFYLVDWLGVNSSSGFSLCANTAFAKEFDTLDSAKMFKTILKSGRVEEVTQ
jgi:hypothetical protein